MSKNRARYQQALEKGLALNKSERWQEAVLAFRAAINEFPRQPLPYVGLGEACFGLRQIDRALDCFKLAARYSGGNIDYLRKVADLQERLGRLHEASQTYLAAGEIHFRRRELDEALGNWERAIRLNMNLLAAHQRLAVVFQRLNETKKAVREYLAIARILQIDGNNKKALQMCLAARRLDPENRDVSVAIRLIQHGEEIIRRETAEIEQARINDQTHRVPETTETLTDAVRQMAHILEAEQPEPASSQTNATEPTNPVAVARRQAQNELAEELFQDDDDDENIAFSVDSTNLSKLERDALIGQGIDFEYRGQPVEAIRCYERAIRGGLKLPAAYFTLGMLYFDQNRWTEAKKMLETAVQSNTYHSASREVLQRLE